MMISIFVSFVRGAECVMFASGVSDSYSLSLVEYAFTCCCISNHWKQTATGSAEHNLSVDGNYLTVI